MRVKVIATGKIMEVNSCYGARLIEQGKAVSIPAEAAEPAALPKKAGKKNGTD